MVLYLSGVFDQKPGFDEVMMLFFCFFLDVHEANILAIAVIFHGVYQLILEFPFPVSGH